MKVLETRRSRVYAGFWRDRSGPWFQWHSFAHGADSFPGGFDLTIGWWYLIKARKWDR